MPMHMLDQECPNLSVKIKSLPSEERRRRLARAALLAAQRIESLEPQFREILELASSGWLLSPQQIESVQAYARSAENQYLDLLTRGAVELSYNWFFKARLATAIWSLFTATAWQDAADAAYELFFVGTDKQSNEAIVRAEIEAVAGCDGPAPGLSSMQSADAP